MLTILLMIKVVLPLLLFPFPGLFRNKRPLSRARFILHSPPIGRDFPLVLVLLLVIPLQLGSVLPLLLPLLIKLVLFLYVPPFLDRPMPHLRALGPAPVFGFFRENVLDLRQACCVFRHHERHREPCLPR